MAVQPMAALRVHHKKQKYKCKDCSRQFIENPTKKYINLSIKKLIEKLLLERISLRGIARVVDVSIKWLQQFVNQFYRSIPYETKVTAENTTNLIIECDVRVALPQADVVVC